LNLLPRNPGGEPRAAGVDDQQHWIRAWSWREGIDEAVYSEIPARKIGFGKPNVCSGGIRLISAATCFVLRS
jgi:hypothetical protein